MTEPWEGAPKPPRRWQAEALPLVLAAIDRGSRGVVSAFMGGGKSILAAEVVHQRLSTLGPDEVMVVGAPRRKLVRQLARTVSQRCGGLNVGAFYTDAKDADCRVVVACYASATNLSQAIAAQGRRVALLVADEAHQTEAETVLEAFEALQPAAAVGFTATPFRASDRERLSLWDEVVYTYTYADGLADGVVAPYVVVNWDGSGDGADVDRICLDQIRGHGQGPGIASALSIEDAEAFAAYLSARGVAASAIHSQLRLAEQEQLLRQLQTGALRCLVHVALLAEGIDLPWLRWICLRRPVGSKVRFVQELGRVLRAHPGKEAAVVMDPHDLLGRHGIHHPERLADALLDDDPEAHLEGGTEGDGERDSRLQMPAAVAVGGIVVYLRGIERGLEAAGLPPRPRLHSEHWHDDRPSDKQVDLMVRSAWAADYLPPPHRAAVQRLASPAVAGQLSKLAASELITVLMSIRDAWKAWKARDDTDRFALPPLDLPEVPVDELQHVTAASFRAPRRVAVGRVTNEHPEPSRRWLEGLPKDHRSMASTLFGKAIRDDGATEPRQVCRAVYRRISERLKDEDNVKLLQIRVELVEQLQLALAFAVDRLRWDALSDDERERIKAEAAKRFRRPSGAGS